MTRLTPKRPRARGRPRGELFALARELGGTVSGEHGLGLLKAGQLLGQWSEAAVGAHEAIKRALDPKGLFNPGKKVPRPPQSVLDAATTQSRPARFAS